MSFAKATYTNAQEDVCVAVALVNNAVACNPSPANRLLISHLWEQGRDKDLRTVRHDNDKLKEHQVPLNETTVHLEGDSFSRGFNVSRRVGELLCRLLDHADILEDDNILVQIIQVSQDCLSSSSAVLPCDYREESRLT